MRASDCFEGSSAVRTALVSLSLLVAAGCGESITEPAPTDVPPDPALGSVAFARSCASCHPSGDGWDLAFFGFSDGDIKRRASAHVDVTTANHILAHVRALPVEPVSGAPDGFHPFQPVDGITAEGELWNRAFDPTRSTADMTATLRSLDLREEAIPFSFPLWSTEGDDSDWLPDRALPPDVEVGMRPALDAYYRSRTTEALVAVMSEFRALSLGPGNVCEGGVGEHVHRVACFDARRWVSSLAAQHSLRTGTQPPVEAVRLWWETGEAAVSVRFLAGRRGDPVADGNPARWGYLAFTFAPAEFPELNGYLSQFLESLGHHRVAALKSMVRMVSDGPVHEADPAQRFHDAALATRSAPDDVILDVAEYVLRYLRDGMLVAEIPVPSGAAGEWARVRAGAVYNTLFVSHRGTLAEDNPARVATIEALRDEVLSILDASTP